ncbi:Plug domain-containing protein [Algoriphagus halophilus]|uniref:Plug domain-containing protein n=1 Tax=Algoriphagus halophilus TaxID=226505 RepID=UPI00358FA85E
MSEGKMFLKFPLDSIPEGVSSLTLFDQDKKVLASRYIFNPKPQDRLQLMANTDLKSYSQRQLTKLNVAVLDSEGRNRDATLSVKVLDEQLYALYKKEQQSLIARTLLFSDFNYSLANEDSLIQPENALELDTWLMTKRPSDYKFHQLEVEGHVSPEYTIGVSGRVEGNFLRKKAINRIEVTLMTFGEQVGVFQEQTDSLGRFNFVLPDMFGTEINALVQTVDEKGQKKDFSILLDDKEVPPISFDQRESIVRLDSIKRNVIIKEQKKDTVDRAFNLSNNFIELEEFTVEDYLMTPQRQEVMNRFGRPTSVVDGDEIESKEEKWSYGLYSILLFNYPELVSVTRININGGFLHAKVNGGGLTLVVVDGIPVMNYDYHLIQNIDPSEVKSFEIIKNAKGFAKLFWRFSLGQILWLLLQLEV